jgi:IS30 family transposase
MRAMTTWFCDAYASWQNGGFENANGRLRHWLPRQTDIDKVSDEEIQDIVMTANLTPRKMTGLQDPLPGNPQRAWQRRANPVCIALLHLAPESRHA